VKFVIGNIDTEVKTGGKDNLIKVDIEKELKAYLSVKVQNSYWATKGKKGWDGTKCFFVRNKFPTGFLPQVYDLCSEFGYEIELVDERENLPKFRFLDRQDPLLHNQFYEHSGKEWSMTGKYDYQADFIGYANHSLLLGDQSFYFPRGIMDAATNAGKNIITVGIINNLEDPRCLFLLHSKDIYRQAVEFFNEFFNFEIGQINDRYYRLAPFTIGMVKSLKVKMDKSMNVVKDMSTYFNTIVVDEAHRAGGKEYAQVVRSVNAGARYFISGTPLKSKDKVKNLVIVGICGPVLGKISNRELQDLGVSMKMKVQVYLNNTQVDKLLLGYDEEKEAKIIMSEHRRGLIVQEAKAREGKQILIAVYEKRHAYYLAEALEKEFPQDVRVVHGEHGGRVRNIEDFKKGKFSVLVTSYIMKEGLNIPNIEVLILGMGGMDDITLLQFIGRLVRDDGSGNEVELIDFYDVGKWVGKHSNYRLNAYKKEQFELIYNYEHTKTGRPKKSETQKNS
jgi:superfamily II DNA or RNA helicase